MRRVVVALDGTALAAAILPDARHLARPDGELVLVRDASLVPSYTGADPDDQTQAVDASRTYLNEVAGSLREDGVRVQVQTMVSGDAALAIDEAARIFDADFVAVATHGRGGIGRILRGSVAWRALAGSPVPILIRHIGPNEQKALTFRAFARRILVPLDGSPLAETALPLAQELALQWNAQLRVTQVLPAFPVVHATGAFGMGMAAYDDTRPARHQAEEYLRKVTAGLDGDVHTHVFVGSPVNDLVTAAEEWLISDIVMASHGRTGLSRAIVGSVTEALIHRLNLPIIVVPAMATVPLHKSAGRVVRPVSLASKV
jgi:nucleotide-binding universal stress UspA family protein